MTDPTVPTAPILGHVEGVELVETGTWNGMFGPATFTPDDLASAVAALDCPSVRRPVLKAGHDANFGVGTPALGYVANMRTSNEGQTLVGDYRGMPGWLTTVDDDGNSVLASAYPDRSIEGEFDYRCQLGHLHPFVVHAVALLGIERPAVGTLESLQELYGVIAAVQPSATGRLVEARAPQPKETPMPQQVSAAATTDDVRRAYYAGPGADWDLWIREMYIDPPELIVDNDADGSILRVPYETAADGTVTFTDPQKVKVTYVNARATDASTRLVVFASRAESRPGVRPAAAAPNTPASTEDGPSNTEGGSAVAFSDEQITTLRQRLGVTDDADETAILAALEEALEERADPPKETGTPPAAPVLPDGVVVIDKEQLEELQVAAKAGVSASQRFAQQDRDSAIKAAIGDGRIPKARQEHYEKAWAADPEGTKTLLASLAKGLVPVSQIGTAAGGEETGDSELDQISASITRLPLKVS